MSYDNEFDKMMEVGFGMAAIKRGDQGTIPPLVNLSDVTSGVAEKLSGIEFNDEENTGCPILAFKMVGLDGEEHTLMMLVTHADSLGKLVRACFSMILTAENTEAVTDLMNYLVQGQADNKQLPELMEEHRELLFGDTDPFEDD